jgi:hypothetical protein
MLIRLGSVLRITAWGQAAEVRASSASVLRASFLSSDPRVYDVTYLWLAWLLVSCFQSFLTKSSVGRSPWTARPTPSSASVRLV